MSPSRYAPKKGALRSNGSSFYKDLLNAALPAIRVSSSTPSSSSRKETSNKAKFSDGALMDKFIPAIKVSREISLHLLDGKQAKGTGVPRDSKLPLKDFINSLLPAISVSRKEDVFLPEKKTTSEKKGAGLFKEYRSLLKELEHENVISGNLSKNETAKALKEKYADSVSYNLPHSILLRYEFMNCVSKLLDDIALLSPTDCELYFTKNFPMGSYPFSGYNGFEVSYKMYASLKGHPASTERPFVLDLFKKIFSIDNSSLMGSHIPITPQYQELLASVFKTPKFVDFFIKFFLKNNQLDKAVRVFASTYILDLSILDEALPNGKFYSSVLMHLRNKTGIRSVANEQPLVAPKILTSFELMKACVQQHDLTKDETYLSVGHGLYLSFLRAPLFSLEKIQRETSEPLLLELLNFLASSPFESTEALEDSLLILNRFGFKVDPKTNLQVLVKFANCKTLSHTSRYTWAYINSKVSFVDSLFEDKVARLTSTDIELGQALFHLIHTLASEDRVKEASSLIVAIFERLFVQEERAGKSHSDLLENLMGLGLPSFKLLWELWGNLIKTDDEPLSTHLFLFLEKLGDLRISPSKVSFITPDGRLIHLEYSYFVRFDQIVSNSSQSLDLPKTILADSARHEFEMTDNTCEPHTFSLSSLVACLSQKPESHPFV